VNKSGWSAVVVKDTARRQKNKMATWRWERSTNRFKLEKKRMTEVSTTEILIINNSNEFAFTYLRGVA
jgi:hypothetical protein